MSARSPSRKRAGLRRDFLSTRTARNAAASRVTYVDSSAIVKLVVREPESVALRAYLRGRRPLVSSALARTEVARAVLVLGAAVARRAEDVLDRIELVRVNDRVLVAAGTLLPPDVRSLDAIHLATPSLLGPVLGQLVTYDARLAAAGRAAGIKIVSPSK
jgi:predicted nucleic acid-binding protein